MHKWGVNGCQNLNLKIKILLVACELAKKNVKVLSQAKEWLYNCIISY
jgi:hypothetical protein